MTITDLAKYSNINERRIREHFKEIKGFTEDDGEIRFPEGSRYPFDLHRYKLTDINKRRCALLDATCKFMYIDSAMLGLPEESFAAMLEELVRAGFLRYNGSDNKYGANAFDTTIEYEAFKNEKIDKRMKRIEEAVVRAIPAVVGTVVRCSI